MFQKLNLFIELTRLKKPIGYMLLFWPCLWGLTIAYDFTGELLNFCKYLIFFLAGAILMRSAGCIINDITDKNFDKVCAYAQRMPPEFQVVLMRDALSRNKSLTKSNAYTQWLTKNAAEII